MTRHPCPECDAEATPESIARSNLSDLGYLHDDVRLECPNGHEWTVGVPIGETEDDTWICDACGGDLLPHFMYVFEDETRVKPKCRDCYYVPDDPIVLDTSSNGTSRRVFVGHHAVTGQRTSATPNDY